MESSLIELTVEDLNCDEYQTAFRVEHNQFIIRTVGGYDEQVEMRFSVEDSRNIAKWLAHATNYQS